MIGSPDYHLEADQDRRELVVASQELQRNNAFADGILTRAVDNIIGSGIRPQAMSQSEDWNRRAEALFDDWARDADIRGMAGFYELQRLACRSWLADGDVGLIKHGKTRQLQIVTSPLIASPFGKENDPKFRDGVEIDGNGRPVAFHVVQGTAAGGSQWLSDPRSRDERTEVKARDFIFLARRSSATQTRGTPVFAQTLRLFDQIDHLIDATVTAARMAACFGLVVKTPFGPDGSALNTSLGGDGKSYQIENFEAGSIKYLELGEEIEQIRPDHPGTNFSDFMAQMVRILGLQLAMPLELVLLDNSRVNFSSMRGGMLQYYRAAKAQQNYLIDHFLRPVWAWLVEGWIASGKLAPLPDAKSVDWVPEGWVWLDPITELQGQQLALDMGATTLSDIVRSQGKDLATVLEKRREELKALSAAGLPDVRSTFTRDPMEATNEPSGNRPGPDS